MNGPNRAWGTVSMHSYNVGMEDDDDQPMGRSVNEMLEPDNHLYQANYDDMPY